jgi:hypothetical protein
MQPRLHGSRAFMSAQSATWLDRARDPSNRGPVVCLPCSKKNLQEEKLSMNLAPLTSRILALSVVSLITASASADVFTMTFEGVGNSFVNNYYNGGAGGNYGAQFVGAEGLTGGYFSNAPSMPTIMFFFGTNAAILNVADGFVGGFSTYYSSVATRGSISLYSEVDGAGDELARLNLIALGSDEGSTYDRWALVGATFAGTAKSVVFNGVANQICFDNVTIGSSVPAPGALALLGAVGLVGSRRRRA